MKEHKPLTPGSGENGKVRSEASNDNGMQREAAVQRSPGSGPTEQVPLRPRSTMQNEIHTRKRRGRLGRDTQAKLGKILNAYFDDVVKEGVPDRFRDLLKQYDERKDKGSS
jgi:Anti-sigma factor NepR